MPPATNTPTSPATPTPLVPVSSTQAQTSAITPASTATTPTIPTSQIIGSTALNLPSAQPSSSALPAASNIGTVAALNKNQSDLLSATNDNEAGAQATYTGAQNTLEGLMNQYLGEGTDEQNLMNEAGVPGLKQTANDLTNQYNTTEQAYNAQYDQIINRPGASLSDSANQIADLQQQRGYAVTNLGIQQAVAQNNYATALQLVQNQIQIKYAPLKDVITYQEQILNNAQGMLSQEQTQAFQANLQVQSQKYTQGTYYANLNAQTGVDMLKSAAANGADAATLGAMSSALSSGGSISDIAAASNGFLQTGNYQLGWNQNSGQYEMYNQNTGQWSSGASSPTPTSVVDASDPNATDVVSGNDGTAYNFNQSGYNTADSSYGLKVSSDVQTITKQFGAVTSAATAQSVIDAYAPSSTVTGQMVMNAAQQAGIDPTVLLAQMKEESLCGASHVAQADNNCGGISYVQGMKNATQGTARPASEGGYYAKFDTPQDGVNAQAALIAKAKVTPSATTMGQTPETQYSLKTISALKQALPQNIAAGVNYLASTGDGYIDSSKITATPGEPIEAAQQQAESYAKQYGLAYLSGDEANAMQDADTALTQINNIQTAWNAVAPNTVADVLGVSAIGNELSLATHSGNSVALTKYMNMVPTAISTLNAITGSKRLSAFSTTVSNDALPTLSGLKSGDTVAQGNAKLDALRQDINASITPIIATSQGAPLSSTVNAAQAQAAPQEMTYGGKVYVKQSDGTYLPQ